ncbi:glycoside hydrolase family 3 protein [Lepidopterella palustris CBS 459.81]|uniref:Probable beta-glucosidase F n=1 Tax=Lepidopterella palustris CBS 459.81 TaxID=1314670 RepID=A0A8E2E718_9PEZI|nr:glycoside hydrolase family 3 protein [Lepidopterella palustris CBS 459.81]
MTLHVAIQNWVIAPPKVRRVCETPRVKDGDAAPPYYPAPHGGWITEWSESYRTAALLAANLTLAEKMNITCGNGYDMERCDGNMGSALQLGIPQLCLQDSPLGIPNSDQNTAFPADITVRVTWDKSLMHARGVAVSKEFWGKGINVHLGPIGRKPRGGRGWEGFGADPVRQAVGGAPTIKGAQEQAVIATIKHSILNEQEMYRIYNLFAEGVKAGVGSVMAAYSTVGSACSQNGYLMNGILKDKLGFQG